MNKTSGTSASARSGRLEKTLDRISFTTVAPRSGIVLILLLYIIASVVTNMMATSGKMLQIGESSIPVASLTGAFSSLTNISVILLAVFYKKTGFIISMVLLALQFPLLLFLMIKQHSFSSIPGLFTNFFTIVSITLIRRNSRRAESFQTRLRDQAVTDRLTGLPNRFACSELLNLLIQRREQFTVVSIDLNNFKSINDTMGFNAGNTALKEIAERWKKIADSGISGTHDFIARLSGDEFGLILRGYRSEEETLKTIRLYESVLGSRLTIDNCDLYISGSFGYAEYPKDADNIDNLFSYADAAMTEVKRVNSSNRILRFSSSLLRTEHTLEIERKLRTALEQDQIYFQLQPQYDLSHKLRGFESLARMRDADGSNVSPGEFIPVAEKVGLIDQVDSAVFRKSATFFGELLRKTGADITLSINTSVRHLMKNDYLDELQEIMQTTGIPAEQLEVEITESIMIDSAEKALQCIEGIKKLGVKIAIDDFGTGYSSLSYLHNFPANLLKIDKSFIDKMNTSDSSKQYVAAIISIGHIMGFDVISEGVEEESQLDTLREIGCDFIQGYIWGRPLPADEAEKLVIAEYSC